MKTANSIILSAATLLAIVFVSITQAATFTWTGSTGSGNASGSWATTTNWNVNGTPGSADITLFNNVDIYDLGNPLADSIVTLDANQAITSMTFSDTDPGSGGNWLLNSGGGGTNTLTLSSGSVMTVGRLGLGDTATINASLVGTAGFQKLGSGTLVLGSTALGSLTGTVTISNGQTTQGNVNGALQITSATGLGTGGVTQFTLGDNNSGWSYLQLSGGITLPSSLTILMSGVNYGQTVVGVDHMVANTIESVSGSNTLSSTITTQSGGSQYAVQVDAGSTLSVTSIFHSALTARSLMLMGAGNGTWSGAIQDNGTTALSKFGSGTWTLAGTNTYIGATMVYGGTLNLDYSAATAPGGGTGAGINLVNASSPLSFNGGTLNINGANAQTDSQTFASTAVANSANAISFTQNGAASISLTLGAISRSSGATIDFVLPTTGSINTSSGTANTLLSASGISYVTVGGTDWAAKNAANTAVVAGSSIGGFYTANGANTIAGNADVGATDTTLNAAAASNNLRFNDGTAARTINLNGNTFATGGILMTSNVGSNHLATISGGTLASAATAANLDLPIIQNDTNSNLAISSIIANSTAGATALTKSGPGTLVLSGPNTYSGGTVINEGTVEISGGLTGTSGSTVQIAPGSGSSATLQVDTGGQINAGRIIVAGNSAFTSGGTGTVTQSGGTINSNSFFSVGMVGSGSYNMTGGILNVNGGGGSGMEVAVFGTASGVVTMSGSSAINIERSGNISIGSQLTQGNGTFNQNGGTVTFYSDGSVNGSGTTLGGTGTLQIGAGGNGIYTYNLNSGTLTVPAITHPTGNGSAAIFNFNGGTLKAATSGGTLMGGLTAAHVKGIATIDTNGLNTTITQSLLHDVSVTTDGGLTKLSNGTLTLSATSLSTYNGPTNVNGGTLLVNGSLSTSSAITVNNNGTLAGSPVSAFGSVSVASGGTFAPGDPATNSGVSTVGTSSLSLASGSLLNFEFGSGNDEITVSGSHSLTINGGTFNLYAAGSTSPFSSDGIYTLFNITNGYAGLINNLGITAATQVAGKTYVFSSDTGDASTATQVLLTIGDATTVQWTNNNNTGNGSWNTNTNWNPVSVPNVAGTIVSFGTAANGGNVTLDGNKTVGGIIFNNTSFSYNITGTDTLILNNGILSSSISVTGTHTISSPVQLANSASITTNNSTDSLTVSNNITGSQPLLAGGPGTVILGGTNNSGGTNNYSTTTVNGGTLQIGSSTINSGTTGTLGTGNVTLASTATLSFNRTSDLTVSNNIVGAGGVNNGNVAVNSGSSTTNLNLSGTNSYASLTVNTGTVNLQTAGALPSNIPVTVNASGTLNLGGNNTSVTGLSLPLAGGVITDNSASAGTTTLSFLNNAQTDFFGAINKGSNHDIALTVNLPNTATNGTTNLLNLHSASTYGGGTTVNAGVVDVLNGGGLGTGQISVTASGSAPIRIQLDDGVTLGSYTSPTVNTDAIVINADSPGTGLGVLTTDNSTFASSTDTATFGGPITINSATGNGGHIVGPSTGTLVFTGPITTGAGVAALVVRGGNVQFSGGGSYQQISITGLDAFFGGTTGVTSIGADNGIATNAIAQISVSGNGTTSTLDLNGHNQTLVGISNSQSNSGSNVSIITNSSSSSVSILTLTPTATSNASFANTAALGTVSITDADSTHPLSIVINGASTGVQSFLAGTLGDGFSFHGSLSLLSSTLVVDDIQSGGSPSGLGASTSDAGNLVFGGGALTYSGTTASPNTDRNFTINPGAVATIDVTNAATTLTFNGNATVGDSVGTPSSLVKGTGAGTLVLNGTLPYHGNTTISGGTLQVNGSVGTSGSGTVNIAAGALLNGTGTINGTLNHNVVGAFLSGGTHVLSGGVVTGNGGTLTLNNGLTLNGGTVRYYVDQNNNSTQDLINVTGSGLTVGASITPIDMELQNPLSTTSTTFQYVLFVLPSTETSVASLSNLQITSSNGGRTGFSAITDIAGGPTGRELVTTVTFGAGHNLDWNSVSDANWDTTHMDWYDNTTTLTSQMYFQGDNVKFVDNNTHPSPGGQLATAITLGFTALPSSVTYAGTNNSYVISGSGKISGPATLTVNGGNSSSTLTLETNNDYSGTTTINSGTLNIGGGTAAGSLGTGALAINSPGTLVYSRSDSTTFAPTSIFGNGNLTFAGTTSETIQNADLGSFGGTLTVQSGIVRPANANNPLSSVNNMVLNGGELYFDTGSNHAPPAVPITINGTGSGTAGANNDGAIRVGSATTSTLGGTVTVGSLTSTAIGGINVNALVGLDGGATLSLTNNSGPALSGTNTVLGMTGGGTLSISGDVSLGATGGIATAVGSTVQFAPNAAATVNVNSPLLGAGPVTITTAGTPSQGTQGTTDLNVDSPSYTGNLTIATGTSSGNLQIQTAGALGSPTTGTLTISGSNTGTNVVGTLLLDPTTSGITVAKPMTLGARAGNGIDVFHIQNVAGNNVLSGAITLIAGGSDYNLDSDAGSLTIQSGMSTSTLGMGNRNIKLSGNGNGTLSGALTDSATAPITIVKSGNGAWTLGANSTVNGGVVLSDNGTLKIASTTTQSFNGVQTTVVTNAFVPVTSDGLYIPSGSPHIDLSTGTSASLKVADSSATGWGGTLTIDNWTYGAGASGDHFIVGITSTFSPSGTGLSSSQLAQIQFTDFSQGASITTTATAARSVGEVTPLIGDVNGDGHVDAADVIALEKALANPSLYEMERINGTGGMTQSPSGSFTASDVLFSLDVNGDGMDTGADVQALIKNLQSGKGNTANVPEPGSFLLLALGGLLFVGRRAQLPYKRKNTQSRHSIS